MADLLVHTGEAAVFEESLSFNLAALCRASGAGEAFLSALVSEGLLQPSGQGPEAWRFAGAALPQARRALRLARDFELELSGLALVLELLAEIDHLRACLRQR